MSIENFEATLDGDQRSKKKEPERPPMASEEESVKNLPRVLSPEEKLILREALKTLKESLDPKSEK